jgi:hypothetical protein
VSAPGQTATGVPILQPGESGANFDRRMGEYLRSLSRPAAPSHRVTGYWLAVVPGQGFGIVHGTGPSAGTPRARFLGGTAAQIKANLHGAVNSLQHSGVNAVQVWEVADGPDKMIQRAVQNGSAWATGPASVTWDTLPTKILAVVLTAALGGIALGAGTGAAAAGGTAAEGAAAGGAATAAGGAAAGSAAAGGAAKVAKAAKGAAKAIGGNSGKVAAAAGALSIAGLFTNISWWKGIGLIVAGAILVIIAIRELT